MYMSVSEVQETKMSAERMGKSGRKDRSKTLDLKYPFCLTREILEL